MKKLPMLMSCRRLALCACTVAAGIAAQIGAGQAADDLAPVVTIPAGTRMSGTYDGFKLAAPISTAQAVPTWAYLKDDAGNEIHVPLIFELAPIKTAGSQMPIMAEPVCNPHIDLKARTVQRYSPVQNAGDLCQPDGPPRPLERVRCQWGPVAGSQWAYTDTRGQLVQVSACEADHAQH